MRKNTWIALLALAVALVGLLVAVIAYLRKNECILCDDWDDDFGEFDDGDLTGEALEGAETFSSDSPAPPSEQ